MNAELISKKTSPSDAFRYLVFTLAGEEYAIPLLVVKEVVALPEITRVPHTPPYFLGIMNIRGQVISVFDLRLKFNMKAENGAETAVIICDLMPLTFGIVVNSVDSVLSLTHEDIKPKPEIGTLRNSEYVAGVSNIESKLILLLDIAKALDVKDYLALQKNSSGKAI